MSFNKGYVKFKIDQSLISPFKGILISSSYLKAPFPPSRSVCLVVNGLYMATGKAGQVRLLAAKLQQAGVSVCIIDRYAPGKTDSTSHSKCSFNETDIPLLPDEIKVFRIPPPSNHLIKQLWRIRRRYKVVCFMEMMYLPACFAFLRLWGKKIVVRFCSRYQPATNKFIPWYKNAWYLVNCLVAVSNTLERDLKDLSGFRGKVVTILNRIDEKVERELDREQRNTLRQRLKLDPSSKIVIFVGGVQRSKGIDLVLDAWKPIRTRVSTARLLILGPLCSLCEDNVDYRGLTEEGKVLLNKKMELFTKKLSSIVELYERITYLGVRANVADYLAASDLFIFASRTEVSPNAPMEAMAAGLPVVSFSNKDVIGEIVRDGKEGILVPYEDSTALAEATISLLQDDKRRRILGHNARLRFKSKLVFDEKQADNFIKLFNSL